MKINKISFVKRFVLIILSLVCIIFATFAWFSSSKVVVADQLSISAFGPSKISCDLFIWENDAWKTIDILEYKNMSPSQEVKYRLAMKNTSNGELYASVSLLNITEGVGQDVKLSDKLMLSQVSVSPEGTGAVVPPDLPKSFTDLMDNEHNFALVNNLSIASQETIDVLFNVKLADDAGNNYQDKSVTVGQLNIVHN